MPAARTAARSSARPSKSSSTPSKPKGKAAPSASMTFPQVMTALEKAGTAQAKKTYARHGAVEPMFGVSFATLGAMRKKIKVDHDLARALWDTGNFDARNLAFKIADPTRMGAADLDRWARDTMVRMCGGYVSMLAQESGRGLETANRWLASKDDHLRGAAWGVVQQLAAREEGVPDAWFLDRVSEIQASIHQAPNDLRGAMNQALISIGGRNAALRKAALAAAKKIGKVEVDHGDTECKTPDAAAYVEKMWAHAKSKGFETPTAQEQKRETPRTRC